VNEILKELESGLLPSFMMDGQSCVLEDLQEVDRSLTDRIAKLMAVGKIEAGPWYVLADQLLVCGESLMRNLEMGLAVTRQFGQPSMIGYCPDTFGHSQDLPRILQSFGITSAIVWRGVPDMSGKSLFWWLSPDGSKVLTYHLSRGYYQTAFFESRTAENLAEHLLSWRTTAKPGTSPSFDAVLVPVGGDHLSTPVDFMKQLQSARLLTKMESLALAAEVALESGTKENLDIDPLMHPDLQLTSNVVAFQSPGEENCLIEANSLRRFVELMLRHAGGRGAKIPSYAGELRDNDSALQFERAYMLQGVLSTRLYLKRENRLSERRLARVLEPAFAFLHCEKLVEYPTAQMNYAWRLLLQNQPHDSICGCSIDEVHREMMHRTGKFHQVLNVLERRATEALYGTEAGPFLAALKDPLLLNTSCLDKKLVIFNLSGTESDAPVMMEWCTAVSAGGDIDVAVELIPQLAGTDLQIQLVERSLQTYIFTGTNQTPETKKVLVNRAWIAPNAAVPAFGYRVYSFEPTSGMAKESGPTSSSSPSPLSTEATRQFIINNDLLTVAVGADGVVKVTANGANGERHNYDLNHRIKDVGDAGDTYNFDPIEDDESLQARFIDATIVSRGPIVSSILLKYELNLPAGLECVSELNLAVENGEAATEYVVKKTRSTVRIPHVFFTEIELRKSVPILFFETRWENLSRDHRLEVLIDTGRPVTKVFAENHFSIVERVCSAKQVSLPVEKGTEAPLDRYPCQRFFIANDSAFFNLGLPEFGVDGDAVSLTILRATSALSRPDLRSRGGGAGPSVETPEANCLGLNKVNYGWAPLDVEFAGSAGGASNAGTTSGTGIAAQTVRAYQLAEQFENLLWITFGAMTAPSKSFLDLSNQSVRIVATRILESNDFIELRLLNVTGETQFTELAISFDHCEALLTTADGRVVEVLNAMNGAGDPDANRDSISCAPEIEAFVPHAVYKIKLGANALVSIRLRLKSRQPAAQPRSGS
jgi:hypothetical protein